MNRRTVFLCSRKQDESSPDVAFRYKLSELSDELEGQNNIAGLVPDEDLEDIIRSIYESRNTTLVALQIKQFRRVYDCYDSDDSVL